MEIKFKKGIYEYKYLIVFDLASHKSGICIWDIANHKPLETCVLNITNTSELPVADLYLALDQFFNSLVNKNIDISSVLVYKEAMPTQVHGGSSTIQTFVALAKSHAILDNYLYQHHIDIYDYIGIYPITWHSYFRKIANLSKDDKVDKKIVNEFVQNKYIFDKELTYDESDAVFMTQTFLESKWNKDIKDEIREKKKHKKTLKANYAIKNIENEIKSLQDLIILEYSE